MLDASGIIIEEDHKVMQDTYALLNVPHNNEARFMVYYKINYLKIK